MYKGKTISVAMATYNGERFIREQLESILNQTVVPDEIIVSDDGSTDRTVEIVLEVSSTDSGHIIKLVTDNPRRGFAFNFGNAVGHCAGDVVFLCDQDDVWLPDKVKHIISVYTENENALCVFHDAVSIDSTGTLLDVVFSPFIRTLASQTNTGEIVELPSEPFCEWAVSSPLINGMVMSVSKKLLETAFPFPPVPNVAHDGWLWFCAEAQSGCFLLNEVLTMRRLHDANTSGAGKQGLSVKRAKKVLHNLSQNNDFARTNIVSAMYKKQYVDNNDLIDHPGVVRALSTMNRILDIGQKELSAAKSGRLKGASKLISLYRTDQRYHNSGRKAFLYELAEILLRSKKTRIKHLEEIGL